LSCRTPPRKRRAAGLLTSQALARLLNEAIKRRQAADALLSIADRVAEAGIAPMSMDEVNAEVKAARAERRARQAKDDDSSRSWYQWVLSALLWHGTPHALLDRVREGTLTFISSPVLLAELAEAMARPKFDTILARSNTSRERSLAEQADGEMEQASWATG
jgi:hypothetical protein